MYEREEHPPLFVDGTPSGLLVAEVSNWTGKVLVAPRTELSDLTTSGQTIIPREPMAAKATHERWGVPIG